MSVKCPKCHHDNPDDTFYCGKCSTALKSPEEIDVTATIEAPKEELTTGSNFAGRYQIIEEIGKGGMGRVYKVQDTKIKEKIALKLIKPEISKDKKTIERFSNELRLARKIRHKNVCQMFDLGEEHGTQFITMEYVSGEDLRSSIRRFGQLPIAKSIAIAGQICEGLAEAHRQGVVHRDLKSNNIMIDRDGNVRIMDFGIARSLETKGITGAGMMIGTPEYMSPEQVEGKEVDHRSDVYSLGIILYEMVTGRLPFEGDTPFAVGVKHKSEIPQNPKELNAQIPDDLNKLILRCLEKEKGSRYQSADEVRSELSQIEKGIPTTEQVIPEKRPLTSREITVTIGFRKLLWPSLAFIALVVAAIVLWKLIPSEEKPPIPQDKPSLAVVYFKNNTGDKNYDHWRSALSDLLISDLAQSKYIRVMGGDRLYNILEQLDLLEADSYSSVDLERIASRGGVNHVLLGNLTKAGDNFRITTTLQKADTGELIGSESVDGIGEDSIISMVDELTLRIKKNFKLSDTQIETDIDEHIVEVTTKSSEAYKYYHEGIRYDLKGDYPKVIEYMEKAVAIDPEFASAYHAMSWAYGNLAYNAERKKFLKKALDLSDRLTDRERFRIQGAYYSNLSEKTYDKAIDAYEKLLELYPDDLMGNNDLGVMYRNIEEWDKSIEKYEACLRYGGIDVVYFINLAANYENKGSFDKARQFLERYLRDISDSAPIRARLALHYRNQGKYELALEEVNKALSLNPTRWQSTRMKGDIYFYMGDFQKAEEEFMKLQETREPVAHVWNLNRLAVLYRLQGRFKDIRKIGEKILVLAERLGQNTWIIAINNSLSDVERSLGNPDRALELLNKVWDIAVEEENIGAQRNALFDMGLAYLELRSWDEAQQTADRLKELIAQSVNQKLIRNYYALMGRIELGKNNYSKAIDFFKKALPLLYETSGSRLPLAYHTGLAYYKAGDLENSCREFEKVISLTTGRQDSGDLYAKGFYMLGKIYEEQGEKAKAIENYEKFLDLWKNADPDLPEVDDARTRLSALKTK